MRKTAKVVQALEEKAEEEFIGLEEDIGDIKQDAERLINEIEGKRGKHITTDPGKTTRVSAEQKRVRLREILELINRGLTYVEIIEYGESRWEVAGRTVERYIKEAKSLTKIPSKDIKHQRRDAVSRALYIYKQAVQNKNPAIALQALKEVNKLNGLYTEQVIVDFSEEEQKVQSLIQEIADNQLTKDDISDGVIKVKKDGKSKSKKDDELIPKDI